ncbi:MAG TPA: DUF4292 domain-containing protein [Myxococcaceae bacterium]|jgi:hypothetical protein
MHKPFYAALLISLAGLLGCPRRIDFGPHGEVRDSRELLALVDQAEGAATSIDAEGQVRFDLPEGQATVGAFVSASAPASLQIQANDFFGRPQSVLACDGQRFGLWVAQEEAYYTGPATPENLARFIRVPLPPEEVVALLLGRAPRIAAPGWALEVDRQEGAYRLSGTDGQRSQSLWIDPVTARPVRSEVTSRGGAGYRARFGDVQPAPAPFPRMISLESLGAGSPARLELRASKLALNETIDPARFSPEAPDGVRVIEVSHRSAKWESLVSPSLE